MRSDSTALPRREAQLNRHCRLQWFNLHGREQCGSIRTSLFGAHLDEDADDLSHAFHDEKQQEHHRDELEVPAVIAT